MARRVCNNMRTIDFIGRTLSAIASRFMAHDRSPAPSAVTGDRDAYGHLNIVWTPQPDAVAWDVLIVRDVSVVRAVRAHKHALFYPVEQQIADFGAPQQSVAIAIYPVIPGADRGQPVRAVV